MKINLYWLNLKSDFSSFVGSNSTQPTTQPIATDSTTTTKNIINTGKNNSKKCYPLIILEKLASTTVIEKLLLGILQC
jgi:hypothetical protein